MILRYNDTDGSSTSVRLKTMASAPVTIGRGKDADVTIDDAKVSRINTAIRYWDDVFVVRDLSSTNGTSLNGEKIEIAILKDGDTLQIGSVVFDVMSEGTRGDITQVLQKPKM